MNFGLKKTVPHLAGVNLGFGSLILVTNLGLGAVFLRFPAINTGLKVVGSAYLLYLAYKVATAGNSTSGALADKDQANPMTFMQAAMFQYVNPKAWVMAATAASTFLPEDRSIFVGAALLSMIFVAVNLPCITTWAAVGTGIGRLLTSQRRRQAVNGVLGLLLVGTVVLINT